MKKLNKTFYALAICIPLFFSACEKDEIENSPEYLPERINSKSNLGAEIFKSDIGRIFCIETVLTGLSECVNMSHTNYLISPSGNETSVWEGFVPTNLIPLERYIYSATHFQDGKTYSSFTELNTDGFITVTLHYRATNIVGDKQYCMATELTNLSECVNMTQTNLLLSPSGNITSVWDGNISTEKMEKFFPAGLQQPYTFSTTYLEDGKTYSVFTKINKSGEITVKLYYKANSN